MYVNRRDLSAVKYDQINTDTTTVRQNELRHKSRLRQSRLHQAVKADPIKCPLSVHITKNITFSHQPQLCRQFIQLYLFRISDISASTPAQWTPMDISLRRSRHCEHLKQQTVVPNLLRPTCPAQPHQTGPGTPFIDALPLDGDSV